MCCVTSVGMNCSRMSSLLCLAIVGIILCCGGPTLVSTAAVDYTNYTLLQIQPRSESHIPEILALRDDYNLDYWISHLNRNSRTPILTHVAPHQIGDIEEKLNQVGINYRILTNDLQDLIQRQIQTSTKSSQTLINFKSRDQSDNEDDDSDNEIADDFALDQYHNLEGLNLFLDSLVQKYPKQVSIVKYGKSYEGRDLQAIVLTNGTKSERGPQRRAVILECGIHSREWVSPASCANIMHWLLTDPDKAKILNTFDLHVILIANPDGYEYTWTSDRLWRKTRSRSSRFPLCRGADANRNFNSSWGKVGASTNPCSLSYQGDHVWSEVESKSLADYILSLQAADSGTHVDAYFSIHSFSQFWMYPTGYSFDPVPNADKLNALSVAAVEAISEPYGTQYEYGPIIKVVYPAAGTSADWAYDHAGIQYAFAIELRDKGKYGFLLPARLITPTAEELWLGMESVLNDIS